MTDLMRPPPGYTRGLWGADRLRALRDWARDHGHCTTCRARYAKPGLVTCQRCLDQIAAYKAKRVALGLCRCGREPADGIASCRRCADLDTARQKKRAAKLIADHTCTRCRKAQAVPAGRLCDDCADLATEESKARYRDTHPKSRRAPMTCNTCGQVGHTAARHTRWDFARRIP